MDKKPYTGHCKNCGHNTKLGLEGWYCEIAKDWYKEENMEGTKCHDYKPKHELDRILGVVR